MVPSAAGFVASPCCACTPILLPRSMNKRLTIEDLVLYDTKLGPWCEIDEERLKEIASLYYATRADELEGAIMARELLILREKLQSYIHLKGVYE